MGKNQKKFVRTAVCFVLGIVITNPISNKLVLSFHQHNAIEGIFKKKGGFNGSTYPFLNKNTSLGRITDRCLLLQQILQSKYIYEGLGIMSSGEINPKIRVIDLSKKFRKCEGFLQKKNSNLFIPFFVESELRLSLNTGNYRDLVIYNYNESKKKVCLNLFIASYASYEGINTGYLVELQFDIADSRNYLITSEKASLYHESKYGTKKINREKW